MSFTLPDNTKAPDEKSANNSFACSVNFNREAVVEIKMRDESYLVYHQVEFVDKDIHN